MHDIKIPEVGNYSLNIVDDAPGSDIRVVEAAAHALESPIADHGGCCPVLWYCVLCAAKDRVKVYFDKDWRFIQAENQDGKILPVVRRR